MDDVERLLKGSVEELDKLLNARTVLGDPIDRDGVTVIPLVSFGFGFGAGGGNSAKTGSGGGTGAGGGIKPVGAVIIDQNGVRVEGVKSTASAIAQVIGDTVATAMGKKNDAET